MSQKSISIHDLPSNIPVFPLEGSLLLPRGQLPLNIFEPRYLAMLEDTLKTQHRLIGMVQPLQIVGPVMGLIRAQLKQIVPSINTRVMAVVKADLNSVIARLLNRGNLYLALAHLQHFLTLAMAPHLCAGRVNPQVLCWQVKAHIAWILHAQSIFLLVNKNPSGHWH